MGENQSGTNTTDTKIKIEAEGEGVKGRVWKAGSLAAQKRIYVEGLIEQKERELLNGKAESKKLN
jgi:hypothetical protein